MIDHSRSDRTAPQRTPPPRPGGTGRWVVVFDPELEDPEAALRAAGLTRVAVGTESPTTAGDGPDDVEALLYPALHVAVVAGERTRLDRLREPGRHRAPVLAVTPEVVHRVRAEAPGGQAGYLQGYRDGVVGLSERLLTRGAPEEEPPPSQRPPFFQDDDESTWGLKAVQATTSPVSGRGIRVAVLDTGFDLEHPDFAGRDVETRSFIPGESVQDAHGHGTHCIGTVCGPAVPGEGRRYGVAPDVELFAGKVLSNEGSGTDAQVLAGIEWALNHECDVLSMSLGEDLAEVSPVYTAVGRRALDQGTLIVAAAGNNADRVNADFGAVGVPANSPHIMAVAALNQQLDVTFFSARTLAVRGGQVDLAGPGMQIYSSWPMPERYNTISGTSMATPHVAGIAALWAEATGRRGRELWAVLAQEAHRLLVPSADVGSGLVVAPQ